MTDPEKQGHTRRPWRTVASMLGVGTLLALIILLAKGPPVDPQDGSRVAFTEADLAQVGARFERTWSRPPTAVELRTAFDRYVRDEVFYREALAQGLDRNDPMVKQSLVRKITLLGTARAQAVEPTDEELKAYFELRTERYRIPASFSLMQVCLNPDERGEQLEADAADLLDQLRTTDPPPDELAGLGDMLMLPNVSYDMSEEQLARTFGSSFRDGVMPLVVGDWEGPVESEFGLHLVKIIDREEARIPQWTEVRERITSDMRYEGRAAAEDQLYAEILPRHRVVLSEGLAAMLEGDDGRGTDTP
jgi:peptidyl-prolyl cis-trans isomerase C